MKNEIKRAVFSKTSFLAILIVNFILVFTMWEDVIYQLSTESSSLNYLHMFAYATSVGPTFYILALICALPYSYIYADEYNTGYYKYAILRTNIKKYIIKKVCVVSISGGIICVASIGLFLMICVSLFGTFSQDNQTVIEIISMSSFLPLFSNNIYIAAIQYVILRTFLAGLFGMSWSVVGLTISAWIPNRYLALISPFVLSFLMIYISYSGDIFWLNPANYLSPTHYEELKYLLPIYYIVFIVLNYYGFRYGVIRRHNNE